MVFQNNKAKEDISSSKNNAVNGGLSILQNAYYNS